MLSTARDSSASFARSDALQSTSSRKPPPSQRVAPARASLSVSGSHSEFDGGSVFGVEGVSGGDAAWMGCGEDGGGEKIRMEKTRREKMVKERETQRGKRAGQRRSRGPCSSSCGPLSGERGSGCGASAAE